MNEQWYRQLCAQKESLGNFGKKAVEKLLFASGVAFGWAPMSYQPAHSSAPEPYVYVSAKGSAVLWRKTNTLRQGVNAETLDKLLAVNRSSDRQVWVFIVECFTEESKAEWSGSILAQTVAALEKALPGFREPTAKVYWNRDKFHEICRLSPADLHDVALGKKQIDLGVKIEEVLCIERQRALF